MSEPSAESASSDVLWDVVRYVTVAVATGFLIWYYFLHTPITYVSRECTGKTLGTHYIVKVVRFPENADWNQIADAIQNRLDELEHQMSADVHDSEVSRFNAFSSTEDWFPVSKEIARVVQASLEISQLSEGSFDVTTATGYEQLSVRLEPPGLKKAVPGLTLDLSAIANGFAVDCVAELLEEHKIANYFIEIGSEVRSKGKKVVVDHGFFSIFTSWLFHQEKIKEKDWVVGIEKPVIEPSGGFPGLQQALPLLEKSLATHQTKQPGELASVAVIAPTCVRAAAWATALFALGEQKGIDLAQQHGIAVLFLRQSGSDVVEVPSKHWQKSATDQ